MPGDQPPCIPIKTPSFNCDNVNLHEQWKLFNEQCKFLLINDSLFSKHQEPVHIAAVLNWFGLKSYQVFNTLNFDAEGKDRTKIMMSCSCLKSISSPHNLCFNNGYQFGSIFSSQCKDQTEFMSKLHDATNDCNFENNDEIVKFLFLIHNTNDSVKDQLIEKLKMTDVLVDIL